VIAKITPDGGIARLVAEPSATNFVAVEPVHEAAAVAELEDAVLPGPSPAAGATPTPSSPQGAATGEE
jgi:rod shape-determining protein MreC